MENIRSIGSATNSVKLNFTPTGSYSDATTSYDVGFNICMTLRDFINEIRMCDKEWGTIEVCGFGRIDYSYGDVRGTISEHLYDVGIEYIKANGGWSMMNYHVKLDY